MNITLSLLHVSKTNILMYDYVVVSSRENIELLLKVKYY